ncbi:MAG: histidine kinase [Chitinophagaceae bacterium]|nr:histidine kinase [Chitinophagaceae bacterium]
MRRRKMRSLRHIAFWTARYLFLLSSSFITGFLLNDTPDYSLSLSLLAELRNEMIYTYVMAYIILPRFFLKKKYIAFFTIGFLYMLLIQYLDDKLAQYMNHSSPANDPATFLTRWASFWGYIGYGPPSVCAVFLVIRMLKLYHKKMEEKEILLRENANAESQLLKARVHPHFLFNTLNNIYSYSYDRPADAVGLAESLSGTMRYMIEDCAASLVPLEKELKMIEDYIQLEKVRYGPRLSVEFSIDGNHQGKMIAPLLMIPFVENAFKHGASQMMEGSWIKMRIFIRDAVLKMEVSNNRPFHPLPQNEKGGIGLSTVRKRLELLYPGSHLLTIDPTPQIFRTLVQIPLQPNISQPYDHVKQ